jgi:hypothetical protein
MWERKVEENRFKADILCLKADLREERPVSKQTGQKNDKLSWTVIVIYSTFKTTSDL